MSSKINQNESPIAGGFLVNKIRQRQSRDIAVAPGAPLAERGKTHGDYAIDAATAMGLKNLFRLHQGWPSLSPSQQNSLDLIATKIGRILSGNPNFDDHWRDISGYAMLICNEIYAATK